MRLQNKKAVCVWVELVLLLTTVCPLTGLTAFADETAPVKRYQASDYFSGTENPIPNSPWRWQFYDWDGAEGNRYVDLEYTREGAFQDGKAISWMNHPLLSEYGGGGDPGYDWGNGSVFLGAKLMQSDSRDWYAWWSFSESEKNGDIGRDYPVRTFTAHEAGTVKISAAETLKTMEEITEETDGVEVKKNVLNDDGITHIRIMKLPAGGGNAEQVWPAVNWALIQGEYTFDEIFVRLAEGDQLTFEDAFKFKGMETVDGEEKAINTPLDTRLLWDPVVEYTEETPPVVLPAYRSSDYFNLTDNPSGPWSWQYYDYDAGGTQRSRYKRMKYVKDSEWINHDPTVTTGIYEWGNNSARIGRTQMVSDTNGNFNDDEKNGAIGRDYPVRVFTAPNSGVVTINSDISTERELGAHIRIMKFGDGDEKGTQVWPAEGWENATIGYQFSELTLEVQVGDMLTFEDAFLWTKEGESCWDTILQWDPTVTYTKTYPVFQGSDPADGAVDVPLNAVHTLHFDKAIRPVPVSSVTVVKLDEEGNAVATSAVCNSSTILGSSLSLCFEGLEEYTRYKFMVDGIGYADGDEEWTTSRTLSFTTGSAVDVQPARYSDGKVILSVNNSQSESVSATLLVLVCTGSPENYTVTETYIYRRDDIGANDSMELAVTKPTGSFLKAIALRDILTAVPYGDATILQ